MSRGLTSATRAVRIALAVAAFAAIGVATLTPSEGGVTFTSFWCIACGELGGLDVLANIVMFVPLGFALALLIGKRWPVVFICMATTLAVELLQIRVVSGRDASASDLLANTLGGWLGTELAVWWRTLVWPARTTARRLAYTWAAGILLVLGGTSWALGPAFVSNALWIQRTPPRLPYEPFTGTLLAFDVDGIDLPDRFPNGDAQLERHLRNDTWTATALVDTRQLQRTRSIIVRIADEYSALVWMDQLGWDLACYQKTRSAELRLRAPKVALVNGLRPGLGAGERARLSCSRQRGELIARAERGDGTREYHMRLTPSLGWFLLSPFNIAFDERYRVVSALWLVALLLPAGYWSSASHRDLTGSGRAAASPLGNSPLGSSGFVASVIAGAVGLGIAPLLLRVSVASWWEWAAAVTALLLGVALERGMRRLAAHISA